MRRQASGRSLEPPSSNDTSESELDGHVSAAVDDSPAEGAVRASSSHEKLKTLQALADSLRSQLRTVEGLIESESAQSRSTEA